MPLPVVGHIPSKAAPTPADLGGDDVFVSRQIDEMHHARQFQERGHVIRHGLANHKHQNSTIGTIEALPEPVLMSENVTPCAP